MESKKAFRVFSDLMVATDGGVADLKFDYVYIPQKIVGKFIKDSKTVGLKCEACGEEVDENNIRVLIPNDGGFVAICKNEKCVWNLGVNWRG